jgi:hypothetical protein
MSLKAALFSSGRSNYRTMMINSLGKDRMKEMHVMEKLHCTDISEISCDGVRSTQLSYDRTSRTAVLNPPVSFPKNY